jgi:hypothetical protein
MHTMVGLYCGTAAQRGRTEQDESCKMICNGYCGQRIDRERAAMCISASAAQTVLQLIMNPEDGFSAVSGGCINGCQYVSQRFLVSADLRASRNLCKASSKYSPEHLKACI